MSANYTMLTELAKQVELPRDGTLSRTIYMDEGLKVVLFGFSTGQELSEHTASMPAIMHFLSGEADVTLGPDTVAATSGTWIHMPAQLPHSIRTKSPVVMLLSLIKAQSVGHQEIGSAC
jgi:quercetin dioxygenase-like cupin family protein